MLEAPIRKQLKFLKTLNDKTHNEIDKLLQQSLQNYKRLTPQELVDLVFELNSELSLVFKTLIRIENEQDLSKRIIGVKNVRSINSKTTQKFKNLK